ncbi:hypothetical protein C0J52_24385 [Blattella germanica]|nr:hypothetical protein C0J52_24385 [Blattella germanica]
MKKVTTMFSNCEKPYEIAETENQQLLIIVVDNKVTELRAALDNPTIYSGWNYQKDPGTTPQTTEYALLKRTLDKFVPSGPELGADEGSRAHDVEEEYRHHLLDGVHLGSRDQRAAVALLLRATTRVEQNISAYTRVSGRQHCERDDEHRHTVPETQMNLTRIVDNIPQDNFDQADVGESLVVLWFHSSNVSMGGTSSEIIKMWDIVLQIKSKGIKNTLVVRCLAALLWHGETIVTEDDPSKKKESMELSEMEQQTQSNHEFKKKKKLGIYIPLRLRWENCRSGPSTLLYYRI